METLSRRLSEEYIKYQQDYNSSPLSERFTTKNYDEKIFRELAKDPKAKVEIYGRGTVDKARTAIHAEIKELADNVQRIEKSLCKSVNLYFKA
jgi:hypothetical protein